MYANLKKKFSQNFLIDKNIVNKIGNLIDKNNLKILEIGPGDGKLTHKIIEKKPKILDLVEIDKDLIKHLYLNFEQYEFINILNEDFLKIDVENKYDLIISNLPYNLSSKILEKITLLKNSPKTLIFMFQKEFAERLLNDDLNSINSLIKCFFKIRLEFHVSKNCFRPIPKIESSVLKFEKLKKSLIKKDELENFIKFKRYVFSYKRKSLRNILKKYDIKEDISLGLRAEKLQLIDFLKIYRQIKF